MEFVRARVTNYKSIDDSGWVSLDGITCLVGKNESGKSAFLQALRKLNPASGASGDFSLRDYPRKGYTRYRRIHKEQPATVVSGEFSLSDEEAAEIPVLASKTFVVHKDYANNLSWDLKFNQPYPDARARKTVEDDLLAMMPQFVYFDDYSVMRGRISVEDLVERRDGGGELDDADRVFLALLAVAGIEIENLRMHANYEHLKAELESAAIGISDELFEFWKQNKQLRVDFDLSLANPADPPPLNSGTILHTRVWNERHRVSVSFDERSRGFVWFFSFLTYFSNLEEEMTNDLVLLLDEPGTNLHAMGQTDFMRFIEERLAARHQVIYTTHSPFMVDLGNLSSVRLVEDMDSTGTVISDDVLDNDSETVFPLQVALGHQMAQSLFLAPHVLMVSNPSDVIYLQMLGDAVAAAGGTASRSQVDDGPCRRGGKRTDLRFAPRRTPHDGGRSHGRNAQPQAQGRGPGEGGQADLRRSRAMGRGHDVPGFGHRGPVRAGLLSRPSQSSLLRGPARRTYSLGDRGQLGLEDGPARFGLFQKAQHRRGSIRPQPSGVPDAGKARRALRRDRPADCRAGGGSVRPRKRPAAVELGGRGAGQHPEAPRRSLGHTAIMDHACVCKIGSGRIAERRVQLPESSLPTLPQPRRGRRAR